MIEGSGATTILDANISSNLEIVINDAIEVRDGDRQITTSGADITITGGNGTSNTGIYGNDQTNSLSIDAGTGAVALGERWLWRRQWCRITSSKRYHIGQQHRTKLNKRICLW